MPRPSGALHSAAWTDSSEPSDGHHSGGASLDITLRGREGSDRHHPTWALTFSTSSILWMNSSSTIGTHHIFFPPWLQLVFSQNHAHRLSTDLGDDSSSNGPFCEKPDRPACSPLRRRAADERNQGVLLNAVQLGDTTRARILGEGMLKATFAVAARIPGHLAGIRPES